MKNRTISFLFWGIIFLSQQVEAQNNLPLISLEAQSIHHLFLSGGLSARQGFGFSTSYVLSSTDLISIGYIRGRDQYAVTFSWNTFIMSPKSDVQIGFRIPMSYNHFTYNKETGNAWITLNPGMNIGWTCAPTVQVIGELSARGSIWMGAYTTQKASEFIFTIPQSEPRFLVDLTWSLLATLEMQAQLSTFVTTYISFRMQAVELRSGYGIISEDSQPGMNIGLIISF